MKIRSSNQYIVRSSITPPSLPSVHQMLIKIGLLLYLGRGYTTIG